MYRTMISLSEPQRAFLRAEAGRLGISIAELIRRIVDQYREGREPERLDPIQQRNGDEP